MKNGIKVSLNKEIIFALSSRAVFAITLSSSMIYVTLRFSPEMQGVFFTFLGFSSLLQISDFGLSYATAHLASHLKATGKEDQLGFLLIWCKNRILKSLLIALPAIAIFSIIALWRGIQPSLEDTSMPYWLMPWCGSMIALVTHQTITPEFAITEGSGEAEIAWKNRTIQEMVGGCVLVSALIYGAELWSLPAYWTARAACAYSVAHRAQTKYRPDGKPDSADWHGSIWPFQWRLGVSSLIGFLVFQAMVPLVLVELGPSAAGRFGVCLAIMNGLLLFSTAWPLSLAPRFSYLISTGRADFASKEFSKLAVQSGALVLIIAGCTTAALLWMTKNIPLLAEKFGDTTTIISLNLAFFVHHMTHCFSIAVRADRHEPMLFWNLLGAITALAVVWRLAANYGLPQAAIAYLIACVIGLAVSILHYRRSSIGKAA